MKDFIPIFVMAGIGLLMGGIARIYTDSNLGAAAAAAVLSSVLFQVVVYFQLGHVDKFALIALITGTGVAFCFTYPAAFLVGRWLDKKRNKVGVG
jgi:cobalamin synthase